ncbi:MAG: hypothetical protein HYT77_02395 [Deltaproteobacteria bacterium]|nr:hypothetical protein [Deltaproteobacteria bacterium]
MSKAPTAAGTLPITFLVTGPADQVWLTATDLTSPDDPGKAYRILKTALPRWFDKGTIYGPSREALSDLVAGLRRMFSGRSKIRLGKIVGPDRRADSLVRWSCSITSVSLGLAVLLGVGLGTFALESQLRGGVEAVS